MTIFNLIEIGQTPISSHVEINSWSADGNAAGKILKSSLEHFQYITRHIKLSDGWMF
jgi:hypothetical protein